MAFKVNFAELKDTVKSAKPSEALPKTNYGTSYKSPYSDVAEIKKRASAPAVLAKNSPPATKLEQQYTALYSQYLNNKAKQRRKRDEESRQAGSGSERSRALSGFFYKRSGLGVGKTRKESHDDQQPKQRKSRLFSASTFSNASSSDQPQKKRESTVKFEDELYFRPLHRRESMLPNRKLSIRDGSIDIQLDLLDLAKSSPGNDLDDYGDGIDEDDDAYREGNSNRSSFDSNFEKRRSSLPEDSLVSIRNHERICHEETQEQYDASRKEFLGVLSIYFVLFTALTILAVLFVFYYNYGFTTPSEHILSANKTLLVHNQSRVLLNGHMLIMIVPVSQLLGFSMLLYRIFPNVSRTKMKWVHWSLTMISSGFSAAGMACCIAYHDLSQTPDLNSLHNYVGVISCVVHVLQLCIGFVYILPCFSWDTRVSLIPYHRLFGGVLLISDTSSTLTGCVQISNKYFDNLNFPQYYPTQYATVTQKSAVLNLVGLSSLLLASLTLHMQSKHHYRRRQRPGKVEADPDMDEIENVTVARKSIAQLEEATEAALANSANTDLNEVQIGSRKSFNLKKFGHVAKGKSIRILINDDQKQKANFTDTDFLISLE